MPSCILCKLSCSSGAAPEVPPRNREKLPYRKCCTTPSLTFVRSQSEHLLISVQEVSNQLAWEARNAGYRGAVTKSVYYSDKISGTEVLKGIEALLRHEVFFYSDDGSPSPAQDQSS